MLPGPDGDFQCIRGSSDEELRAQAYIAACEKVQGLFMPVITWSDDENLQLVCEAPDLDRLSPEEFVRDYVQSQCKYMLDDGGVCAAEIPNRIVDGQPVPLPRSESEP